MRVALTPGAVQDEVVFVLPNKMGGVFSYVRNLLAHRQDNGLSYAVVRTDNLADGSSRAAEQLPADREQTFCYSLPPDNVHSVLRRLRPVIGRRAGVIVASDWIELALTARYDTGRAVVSVTHGDLDYYYNLAGQYRDTIDVFVTHSTRMLERLRQTLPERHDSIVLLPYGVDIPVASRRAVSGALRLLFVGRLVRDKGIFDLPLIDRRLRELGVNAEWTIVGAGPDENAVKAAWTDRPDVKWTGSKSTTNVLPLYREHDVLVLPSRYEGLPVVLLEAGAAGMIPVASDLASGIPDVVEPGITGYRPEAGNIEGFAQAIAALDHDRALLEQIGQNIRRHVTAKFEASRCAAAHQQLHAHWREWKRPRPAKTDVSYGTRLDQPWLPNSVVRTIRTVLRAVESRVKPVGPDVR